MITIKRITPDDPSVKSLIQKLDRELWERYPTEQAFFDNFNKLPSDARVVIAFDGENAVGCGAFKPMTLPEKAVEIKRMYVDPAMRGRAIGVLILESLEAWAIEEDHDLDRVFFSLLQGRQRVDLIHLAVDAQTRKALSAQLIEQVQLLALALHHQRRQDHHLGILW